jgi:dynein assembly factor 1
MKGNEFVRKYKNYRKTFIVNIKELKYLDDRPVADDERLCIYKNE